MFDLKMKILIVDDFESMRIMMSKAFNELGYTNIIQAADGEAAFEQLLRSNPPVEFIVSDWNMPKCTGIDFLKKVRADAKLKHLPFILATTEGEKENVLEAVKAGVSNFVVKPFTTDVFRKKLEAVYTKVRQG